MPEICASVLNANFLKWKQWLPLLEKARVRRMQFDIMDNKFVSNTGVESALVGKLRPNTKMILESHLMVEKPEEQVGKFAKMGNDIFIFHVEATKNPLGLITAIEGAGMHAGIAVNNKTPVEKMVPMLPKVGLALVMSVDAGFGGQKFNPAALEKISLLRKNIDAEGFGCLVEVDGGINPETGKACAKAGADILVAGSFIFRHPKGIAKAVEELQKT